MSVFFSLKEQIVLEIILADNQSRDEFEIQQDRTIHFGVSCLVLPKTPTFDFLFSPFLDDASRFLYWLIKCPDPDVDQCCTVIVQVLLCKSHTCLMN